MRFWVASVFLVFVSSLCAAEPLRGYAAEVGAFTVSGVSSGGYMAVQMHIAYSSRVHGAAAIAAGPYYCARGSLWSARDECMTGAPAPSRSDAERFEREKRIDPLANLPAARVWLFSGTQDRTVVPGVVAGAGEAVRALRCPSRARSGQGGRACHGDRACRRRLLRDRAAVHQRLRLRRRRRTAAALAWPAV